MSICLLLKVFVFVFVVEAENMERPNYDEVSNVGEISRLCYSLGFGHFLGLLCQTNPKVNVKSAKYE